MKYTSLIGREQMAKHQWGKNASKFLSDPMASRFAIDLVACRTQLTLTGQSFNRPTVACSTERCKMRAMTYSPRSPDDPSF